MAKLQKGSIILCMNNAAEPVATSDNFTCPHCQKEIEAGEIARWNAGQMGKKGGSVKSEKKTAAVRKNAKLGGLAKSEKKAASSVENGKKGGRPRKQKPEASSETHP